MFRSLLLLLFTFVTITTTTTNAAYDGGKVTMRIFSTTSTFVQMCLEFHDNDAFEIYDVTLRPYQWSNDLNSVQRYDYIMNQGYADLTTIPSYYNSSTCFETKRGTPIQDEDVHFIYTPSSVILNPGTSTELVMNLFLQSLNTGDFVYDPDNPPTIVDPALGDDNVLDGQATGDFIGGAVRFDAYQMACEYGNHFREGVPSGYARDYVSARQGTNAMWSHGNPSSCGRCMLVKGVKTNRWVELMVTDACPTDGVCAKRNWIDMSPDAMNELEHYSDGVHQQTHKWAPCTRITGNIDLRLEPGSYNGAGWFNIRNFRYPLVGGEIGCGAVGTPTSWVPLSRYSVSITNLWSYNIQCPGTFQFKFVGFNEVTRTNVEINVGMQDLTLDLGTWRDQDHGVSKVNRPYRQTTGNFPAYTGVPQVDPSCDCNQNFPCTCGPTPQPTPFPTPAPTPPTPLPTPAPTVPCGDGVCDVQDGETCANCPDDCRTGDPTSCGDGICQAPEENCENCLSDCRRKCGGGGCAMPNLCCGLQGGFASTCSASGGNDCNGAGYSCQDVVSNCCGDGTCDDTETAIQCPNDCATFTCGANGCEAALGENCDNCPTDCGCTGQDETCSGGVCVTPMPSPAPTEVPTDMPTEEPTDAPTAMPTEEPTDAPTAMPTEEPTDAPTAMPTEEPTDAPTPQPTPECLATSNCPGAEICDNGVCTLCGNGVCESTQGEDCDTCTTDCGCTGQDETCSGGVCVTPMPSPVPTEFPTDMPTEEPTDAPTDMPTEQPTQAPGTCGLTQTIRLYHEGSGANPTYAQFCLEFSSQSEFDSFGVNGLDIQLVYWDPVNLENHELRWYPMTNHGGYGTIECFNYGAGSNTWSPPSESLDNTIIIWLPASLRMHGSGCNEAVVMERFLTTNGYQQSDFSTSLYWNPLTWSPPPAPVITPPNHPSSLPFSSGPWSGGSVFYTAVNQACLYGDGSSNGIPTNYQDRYIATRLPNRGDNRPGMWEKSMNCGRCMKVTNIHNSASVELMVTDACPPNGPCARVGWFDLSPGAVTALGYDPSWGIGQIRTEWTPCTLLSGNIEIQVATQSSIVVGLPKFEVQFRRHNLPIYRAYVRTSGSGASSMWQRLKRVSLRNGWRYDGPAIVGNLKFRLWGRRDGVALDPAVLHSGREVIEISFTMNINTIQKGDQGSPHYETSDNNFTPPNTSGQYPPIVTPSFVSGANNGYCDDDEGCDASDCVDSLPDPATEDFVNYDLCGDGVCHVAHGENYISCNVDCNPAYSCGQNNACDSRCTGWYNQSQPSYYTCTTDPLPAGPHTYCCGDGVCGITNLPTTGGAEWLTGDKCPYDCELAQPGPFVYTVPPCSGPQDCSVGEVCDNGVCTLCGNGVCDATETVATCCTDCLVSGCCNDGQCTAPYTCQANACVPPPPTPSPTPFPTPAPTLSGPDVCLTGGKNGCNGGNREKGCCCPFGGQTRCSYGLQCVECNGAGCQESGTCCNGNDCSHSTQGGSTTISVSSSSSAVPSVVVYVAVAIVAVAAIAVCRRLQKRRQIERGDSSSVEMI